MASAPCAHTVSEPPRHALIALSPPSRSLPISREPIAMSAEEPSTSVLRGVQLEPAPESPFASAARGPNGSPLQPGSPTNSLSSSRAASAEPSALQTAPNNAAAVDGAGATTDAADGEAAVSQKKIKVPQNRTVSWNVALSTVREYEISETHSENDWGSGRCCCCVQ